MIFGREVAWFIWGGGEKLTLWGLLKELLTGGPKFTIFLGGGGIFITFCEGENCICSACINFPVFSLVSAFELAGLLIRGCIELG